MLLALAKAVGDLDEEYEASVLGSEGVELFTEKEKLSEREEAEIGRRVFLTFDGVGADRLGGWCGHRRVGRYRMELWACYIYSARGR